MVRGLPSVLLATLVVIAIIACCPPTGPLRPEMSCGVDSDGADVVIVDFDAENVGPAGVSCEILAGDVAIATGDWDDTGGGSAEIVIPDDRLPPLCPRLDELRVRCENEPYCR